MDPVRKPVTISRAKTLSDVAAWSDSRAVFRRNLRDWADLVRTLPGRSQVIGSVIVLPRQSHDDYMNLLALADVSLDSLPFTGGNTTYQALAMGTPVVTMPGQFLRGRLSLAIYAKAGVTDLVAKDLGDYVALALRAAQDRAWRDDVMARIEARAGVIFEDQEYLADVERFLATVAGKA